jgi:hypothetical protein
MIKPVDIKHPPREKEWKIALLTASAGLSDEINTREEQFADPMDHLALKIVRALHGRTDALPERNDIAVPKGNGLSPNGGQQQGAAVRIGDLVDIARDLGQADGCLRRLVGGIGGKDAGSVMVIKDLEVLEFAVDSRGGIRALLGVRGDCRSDPEGGNEGE